MRQQLVQRETPTVCKIALGWHGDGDPTSRCVQPAGYELEQTRR